MGAKNVQCYFATFDVTTTYIDGTDIENFERAILPNTTVIYLESPNSWDYEIQDLKAVAELAKSKILLRSLIIVIARPFIKDQLTMELTSHTICNQIYRRPQRYIRWCIERQQRNDRTDFQQRVHEYVAVVFLLSMHGC